MIKEKAYAKINIGLDIVRKRSDNYHDIDTIMQTIELHDTVTVRKSERGIDVSCNHPGIPSGEGNTAYVAASVYMEATGIDGNSRGVSIEIEKRIPAKAGLGGGSSDAAATLRAMDKLFCTNFGTNKLLELALKIGSDVPFLVEGGTARAFGRGEKLEKLPEFNNMHIVLVIPDTSVSTPDAYAGFGQLENPLHPDMDAITDAISKKDTTLLGNTIGNTFERIVFPIKPEIEKALHDIISTRPDAFSMTGSGSVVYGVYNSYQSAVKANELLSLTHETCLTRTVGGVL